MQLVPPGLVAVWEGVGLAAPGFGGHGRRPGTGKEAAGGGGEREAGGGGDEWRRVNEVSRLISGGLVGPFRPAIRKGVAGDVWCTARWSSLSGTSTYLTS
jgi:hypothetical protein